jgi:16S rRNA (adenine1518-N6/adenine1519-N6)-dimethyltransferase
MGVKRRQQLPNRKPDGAVRAKKALGQHFLVDLNIARNTAEAIRLEAGRTVIEVGPGMGVLTRFLLEHPIDLQVVEIDRESVAYLNTHFPALQARIIEADFLRLPLDRYLSRQGAVIGNFPYNISSQILFHCLDHLEVVDEICGMFQKEVAERIASIHGNKTYGILSVVMQTWYDCEYLFTVHEHVFQPPPKVKSAVIRLRRKTETHLKVPKSFFMQVVKMAFNQRRKTLRNALRPMLHPEHRAEQWLHLRAEQLSISEFHQLAEALYPHD